MKFPLMKVLAISLLALCFSASAVSQLPTAPLVAARLGSIVIYVSGEYGKALPVPADMRLVPSISGSLEPIFPREIARGWIFSQKPERPTVLLSAFETLTQRYPLPLKGRAWVAVNGGQVMHLETDLVKPIKAAGLMKQHFIVDYAPVSFPSHKVTLWLPENVNLFLQYQKHYLHYYHHYSNFTLFWVGTSQKIDQPKEATKQN